MRPSHQISILYYWRSFLKPHWEEIQRTPISRLSREAKTRLWQWWKQEVKEDEFHPAFNFSFVFTRSTEEQDCFGVVKVVDQDELAALLSVFRTLAHECDSSFYF